MTIDSTGRLLLLVALGAAVWAGVASALGTARRNAKWTASGQRALVAAAGLVIVSTGLLLYALANRDFSLAYVAAYTSRSTPRSFTLTALWAGMEGSLLFWTAITSAYALTAVLVQTKRRPDLTPPATAVFGLIIAFFIGLLAFGANPFQAASPVPLDGAGLNPLLQSPFMAIHPVLLYLGLTGFAVPFAFAMASLITGRLDVRWFTSTRRWTVLAWSFLTLGVLLGSAWAYMELGWGGYWAWDPVENSSLLPWLTGTAFLHSVMIQERRGMLKIWNVALVLTTYCLAIFGTFLTRSGLVTSVHTFSESAVGKYFLPFLGVLLVAAFGLLGWRFEKLRSKRHLDSILSREAMFLFNNLFFVTIAFTVLWGTLYPVLVEAVSGKKISVGPPFFNTVVTPMGIALLALTGIGPLVAWRKATSLSLRRQFAGPITVGAAVIASLAARGVRSPGALFALGLSAFVATATLSEFARGARAHRGPGPFGWLRGLIRVVGRNRRRYGGYVVHLGVVLIFVGLSGTAFRQSWAGVMTPGQSFKIGSFSVKYESARSYRTPEKMVNMAVMKISDSSGPVATLKPQRNFHIAQRQPQSEIGLRSTLSQDLYLVLTEMDRSKTVTMRAWINPLVAWIWIGGAVMAAGMIIILSGRPPESPVSQPKPVSRDKPKQEPALEAKEPALR
ncbi:MAG: heme lyase CcmF/NrfE family subunit [Actinomycetota bacterium]